MALPKAGKGGGPYAEPADCGGAGDEDDESCPPNTMLLVLGAVDVLGLRKKIVGVSERGHDGR